jgi:transposase
MAAGEEAAAIKKSRFVLLKNPWNLTRSQRSKLAEVQRTNRRLYRAYLLKETLARALDYRQPRRAERSLKEWLAWASRSQLQPFVKAARTIRKHLPGILAYIRTGLTNGLVEGLNAKVRMITRRAYGFHSHEALIGMVFLCCGGVHLDPPLPTGS